MTTKSCEIKALRADISVPAMFSYGLILVSLYPVQIKYTDRIILQKITCVTVSTFNIKCNAREASVSFLTITSRLWHLLEVEM